ncbi:Holo-[acyl-carrier-protein] synthase [Buchnera aphidicola (Cinara piceae)]|uniref:Holo-[acyl-carrier-protein] synthase n=1 Tax=Buchnera aphidicola (Cinara piceae) TaxID=1660043 RepID=A0A803FTR6_9GAMM|nr:holo-ACP synthase [Buchnera aphidicola]VFP88225.1 Holo-[acyl-carrier-protein] synthase [Buchnera aphidicola (Cinara piceae)]
MSIIGIGIDLIDIKRFKKLIFRYGIKIPYKILTERELYEYNHTKNYKEKFLAKRFTAKEATAKAMGIGIYQKMFLKNCEVIHNIYGKPKLNIFGYAGKILKKLKTKKIFLSITDSKKYMQSIVILEK